MDVKVVSTPVFSDAFVPMILAVFSEPIRTTSITTETVFIEGYDGVKLDSRVTYSFFNNQVILELLEPLLMNQRYKVTLTTGIYDTSGNPMDSDYVWYFFTKSYKTYLPITIR